MNKTTRYYKLNWPSGGHAIIKRYGKARILKGTPKFNTQNEVKVHNTVFGYFIYGSKRGYDEWYSKKHLFFSNVDNIQEISAEDFSNDHFAGLL